jgi:hypothetical protein
MSNLSDLYPSGGSEEVAQTLLDHFVLLNGDAEALQVLLANDVTPASFATWISGAGKEAKFTQLISAPNGAAAISASSTAMTAVAASSTAMNAVAASSIAMNAVAASSTAMNAVIASSTALNAVVASSTAMNAVAASSTAMNAVIASSTALNAVIASSTALNAVVASSTAMNAVVASSTAMNAVAASSTAMNAVIASSTALNAVAVSSTAMDAVAASDTASDAIFTSSIAKLVVWNSNTALSAYQANPTQVQRQITVRGITFQTSSLNFTYVSLNTKVILFRAFHDANCDFQLTWNKTSTTVTPTVNSTDGILLPNGDSLGTSIAAIGRTTTYANSGTIPTENNANSNVVSAANGLRRLSRSFSYTPQTVIYITV